MYFSYILMFFIQKSCKFLQPDSTLLWVRAGIDYKCRSLNLINIAVSLFSVAFRRTRNEVLFPSVLQLPAVIIVYFVILNWTCLHQFHFDRPKIHSLRINAHVYLVFWESVVEIRVFGSISFRSRASRVSRVSRDLNCERIICFSVRVPCIRIKNACEQFFRCISHFCHHHRNEFGCIALFGTSFVPSS